MDLVGGISRGAFYKAIEALVKSPTLDGVISLGFGYAAGIAEIYRNVATLGKTGERIADDMLASDMRGKDFIMDVISQHAKPVILASENAYGVDREKNEAIIALHKRGIVVYPTPDRAANVLAKMLEYNNYLAANKTP